MTDKTLTVEDLPTISLDNVLRTAWPVLREGKRAAFRLRLPCGCVATYALSLVEEDASGCENAETFGSIDKRELN